MRPIRLLLSLLKKIKFGINKTTMTKLESTVVKNSIKAVVILENETVEQFCQDKIINNNSSI